MGQTVCYLRRSTFECRFEEYPFLQDLVDQNKTNWNPVIFSGIGLIGLILLWLLSGCIRFKDFTRCYVICQLLPYTVTVLSRLFLEIYDRTVSEDSTSYDVSNQTDYESPAYAAFRLTNQISMTATGLNLPIGTAFFLLMSVIVACTRRMPKFVFFICMVLSFAAGVKHVLSMEGLPPGYMTTLLTVIRFVAQAAMCANSVMFFVILFALCCCSRPRNGQASEPCVSNAKSRMTWCLPYSIFSLMPLSFGMSVTNFFATMTRSRVTMQDDWFWVIFHSFALADLMEPIVFSLSVMIFLPAYRSTLFGMQGYSSPKVAGLPKADGLVKEKQVPPPQLTLPLTSSTLSATPTASGINLAVTPPINGHYDHNLVAMLTTPSAMHTLPNSVPVAVSVPAPPLPSPIHLQPAYVQQTAVLSEPVTYSVPSTVHYVPTQQVVSQPMLSPVQPSYFMTQVSVLLSEVIGIQGNALPQSSLVRYASQPNLTTFGGLQPSISMPHLGAITAQNGSFFVRT